MKNGNGIFVGMKLDLNYSIFRVLGCFQIPKGEI